MKSYLSLIKFSHTVFALPFALVGFVAGTIHAGHGLDLQKLVCVLVCMVTARSAAMAFNRWADAHFDAMNPRTAVREIPAGIISSSNALVFVLLNCAAFVLSTFFINTLCLALSPVALAVVLGYSYTKRFTPLCHLVLGVGLALAPLGAWLAVTGEFHWLPLSLSGAVLTWVAGFDIIYALQDEEFDRSQGLKSIPAALGGANALRLSEVLHLISAGFILLAGYIGHFGWYYWAAALFFSVMLIRQHLLVKVNDLSRVDMAFFTTNGIASVVFGVFVILDMLIK
jgi:4-hydroxybenzoate polyprenyltransferase